MLRRDIKETAKKSDNPKDFLVRQKSFTFSPSLSKTVLEP